MKKNKLSTIVVIYKPGQHKYLTVDDKESDWVPVLEGVTELVLSTKRTLQRPRFKINSDSAQQLLKKAELLSIKIT